MRGRGALRGAGVFRRLPDHAVDGDCRAFVAAAAAAGRQVHPDGGRDRLHVRDHRRVADGQEGAHGHLGAGLFAQAGGPGLRGDGRDSVRDRQRAARRSVHGGADPREPGGRDAGALGHARRPQHRGADGVEPPGRVRHDRGGLQHRRDLPHAGDPVVRRGGGPHARAAGDSRKG